MKVNGIVRKIDRLGRIVIPIEIRNIMGICEGDFLEILQSNNGLMVRKYNEGCIFCGEKTNGKELVEYRGIKICEKCRNGVVKV